MVTTVIKRDSEIESFDVSKIKRCIAWASEGLDVNPIELEATVSEFPESISTADIQSKLVYNAKNLCSAQSPDWSLVAGRLEMMNLWKTNSNDRPTYNRSWPYSYPDYIAKQVDEGVYSPDILTLYKFEELETAGTWIDFNYDLDYDIAGVEAWKQSYLAKNELPQEALLTIALLLASVDKSDKLINAKNYFDLLRQRKISLATPFLANLRRPNTSLSSCFILSAGDDLDSIMDTVHDAARISKNGGGVGVNLSRLRCNGSWIKGVKGSTGGVIPFTKYFDVTATAVNQEGRRKGAITVSLDVWHMDILDFLELRLENKDIRMTAHDIFPQVVVPDLFMRRIEEKGDWLLVDPYEVEKKFGVKLYELWGNDFEVAYKSLEFAFDLGDLELAKKIPAKEILIKIIKSYEQSGLPYIVFKDTVNKANPNKGSGYIPGANLCVESYSNVLPGKQSHVCNLASLNLANIGDRYELETVVKTAVRILDNGIELTNSPIESTATHNRLYRTIGLGTMGLADYLAKNKIKYESNPVTLKAVSELYEDIAYFSIKASADLAVERGTFEAYPQSQYFKGEILCHDYQWFSDNSKMPLAWSDLFTQISETGIRNSHIQATAPNTSSALLQGCSPSFLPVRSRFYVHKKGNGFFPVVPPHLKQSFWFYKEASRVSPFEIIHVAATMQKWIDTGISMELLVDLNNPDVNAGYFRDLILHAWKSGCKTIYYIRFIQRDSGDTEACTTCAN